MLRFNLFVLFLSLTIATIAQQYTFELDKWWYPNGAVNSIAVDEEIGNVYLGGDFDELSSDVVNCAWIDRESGIADFNTISPRGVPTQILAVEEDDEGNTIIGGLFNIVGTSEANDLMRVNADGELDSWFPNVSGGSVSDLLLHEGTLFVAGDFEAINGAQRNGLAAFDYETGILTSWNPEVDDIDDEDSFGGVNALEISEDKLYIAGFFDTVDGVERSNIASFHLDDLSLVSEWSPSVNNGISDILLHDGVLYMAGSFTVVSGANRRRLAAVGASGFAPLTIWDPNANSTVFHLEIYNEQMLVCGAFTSIGADPRDGLASVNLTDGEESSWSPVIEGGGVFTLKVISDTLYMGGSFTGINGLDRNYLASIDIGTLGVTEWNPAIRDGDFLSGSIYVIDQVNTKVFAGGTFSTINQVERNNFCEINGQTGVATEWHPEFNGEIEDICITEEFIIVGGDFSLVGNPDYVNLVAFDRQTKELIDWTPSPDNEIRAMIEVDGILYLVGNFLQIDGLLRNRLVAIDLSTLEVTDWQPVADGNVLDIDIEEDRVFVTGGFNAINGVAREGIASINRTTGVLNAFNASIPSGFGDAIKYDNNRLYIGGEFSNISGGVRESMACISAITGNLITTFNANLPTGESVHIYDIEFEDGRMFISGDFESIDGEDIEYVAEIDNLTGDLITDTPFQFSPPAVGVFDIQNFNNSLLIGGQFLTFTAEKNFVAFGPLCFQPMINSLNVTNDTICPGQSTVLSISGSLVGAEGWFWYEDECGFGNAQTGQSILASPTATTTYYVRGEGACSFDPECVAVTVTVVPDEEPPFIPPPVDSEVSVDQGFCFFTGELIPPEATDNCSEISWENNAPDQLPLGTTSIEWIATDESGLSSIAMQEIIVSDTEPPLIINCPEDQTVVSNQIDCAALADWMEPIAVDNCSQEVVLSSNIAPGDLLIFGLNEINYTTTDESGNEVSCTFSVEVLSTILPLVTKENITCNGFANGTINVTHEEEPTEVTIAWNGPMEFTSTDFELENLPSGTYFAELSQENGCTATIEVEITEPQPLTATAAILPITFGNDGGINLTIEGGTGTYSSSWVGPEGFSSNEPNLSDLSIAGTYQVTVTDENACTFDLEVELLSVLSSENGLENEIVIFPNPFEKTLNLHLSALYMNQTVELFDLQGRRVISTVVQSTEQIVDVSNLSKGTYYLRIQGANKTFPVVKVE